MTSLISRPARVGLITDQTGALSFMGVAKVNLAKMVTERTRSAFGTQPTAANPTIGTRAVRNCPVVVTGVPK